jgi:hypothetical protein
MGWIAPSLENTIYPSEINGTGTNNGSSSRRNLTVFLHLLERLSTCYSLEKTPNTNSNSYSSHLPFHQSLVGGLLI